MLKIVWIVCFLNAKTMCFVNLEKGTQDCHDRVFSSYGIYLAHEYHEKLLCKNMLETKIQLKGE